MQQARNEVFKLIAIQTAIVVVCSLFFLFISWETAYSLFLGGVVCVLPSIYFAQKLFAYLGARLAKQAIRAFYFGEIIKLVMLATLSIIVFKFIRINALTFFFGFMLAQLGFWIAPTFLFCRRTKVLRSAT